MSHLPTRHAARLQHLRLGNTDIALIFVETCGEARRRDDRKREEDADADGARFGRHGRIRLSPTGTDERDECYKVLSLLSTSLFRPHV